VAIVLRYVDHGFRARSGYRSQLEGDERRKKMLAFLEERTEELPCYETIGAQDDFLALAARVPALQMQDVEEREEAFVAWFPEG
jgi:hypothetical protein